MVVDANFLVFLETHSEEELLEYIGIGDSEVLGKGGVDTWGQTELFS